MKRIAALLMGFLLLCLAACDSGVPEGVSSMAESSEESSEETPMGTTETVKIGKQDKQTVQGINQAPTVPGIYVYTDPAFDLTLAGEKPVLLGGGVGVPPMYNLAKKLVALGKEVKVILGFNTASEVFYEEEFKALGCDVTVTTVDGSYGIKGFVTTALEAVDYTYFYTCGPEPMLRAVCKATDKSGQLSFEERMGCGFGACMGCSCKTLTGNKRICKDGPVMRKEEIIWEK